MKMEKKPAWKHSPSPLHLNADIFTNNTLGVLYKFTTSFFPSLTLNALNLLLDMERYSHSVTAAMSAQEKAEMIRGLEGISVEICYIVRDKQKEMMNIPIYIHPAEVLKKAAEGREKSAGRKKMEKETNQILYTYVLKAMEERFKSAVEGFFSGLLKMPKVPEGIMNLFNWGIIDKEGRLKEGATIKDLLSGEYARSFQEVLPKEMINEGMMIGETIGAYYDIAGENYPGLLNELLKEKGILEVTLGDIKKE